MRADLRLRLACLGSFALLLAVTSGCPSSKGDASKGPQWPKAESIAPKELPSTVSWPGVYFINTGGSRGTMHLLSGGEDKIHGCWLAEDKHARATFTGIVKENVAELHWVEKRVGFVGPPVKMTAYFVMTPDADTGRDRIAGEFGEDETNDSGSAWEGIRQKNQVPSEEGCKIDEGETIPSDSKPLE